MAQITIKHERGLSSTICVRGHEVVVDVPQRLGGEDRGPTSTELFVASLGSCSAYYIAQWCQRAGVPHEGLEIDVSYRFHDKKDRLADITIVVKLPPGFPEERRAAALRLAKACLLHKSLHDPPTIETVLAD